MNFAVLWLYAKVFSMKVLSMKTVFFVNVFSLESFPLYCKILMIIGKLHVYYMGMTKSC